MKSTSNNCDILSAYDYYLPPELVAQTPARRRTEARLLVSDSDTGHVTHQKVADLPLLLQPGDLLVLNNARVIPARLLARKPSGGLAEIFLLNPAHPERTEPDGHEWQQALIKGKIQENSILTLSADPEIVIRLLEKREHGQALIEIPGSALDLAARYGLTPLPPYIKRPRGCTAADRKRYQTVFARNPGAVAAPTAGLHFTNALLAEIKKKGVDIAFATLHVGYGTFSPPRREDLQAGNLHGEWVEVDQDLVKRYRRCRDRGGRVIAVGTTSARALEWAALSGCLEVKQGWCHLFIAPGFEFKILDGLMTNFHLPRTTLLMLVSAFMGREKMNSAYAEAIRERYRFYSFGDAMLIL
ncbi:MAG: tRNA preQ1(34) S-adenosylmethionine ribosyltransferase-isomerase QueA [Desulfarculales bacterium]|jgi:S-adenosylmethionine:tRNA ribosyltransferase-isomerase|nr:tRNA preQ1(34) S-adenosylmethionine ribosyltransferase-isomerase QueA [Desulfarculales bacterium]